MVHVTSDGTFRMLFESSPEGILLAAGNRTIVDANPEACRILIRTRDNLLAVDLDTIFDLSDTNLGSAWEEQRRTGIYAGELRLMRGNEASFLADVSMTAYRTNGREDSVGIIFRDISEREQIEEKLVPENKVFWRGLMEKSLSMLVAHSPDTTPRHSGPSYEQATGRFLVNLARGTRILNRQGVPNGHLRQPAKKSEVAAQTLAEVLTPREMEVLCLFYLPTEIAAAPQ